MLRYNTPGKKTHDREHRIKILSNYLDKNQENLSSSRPQRRYQIRNF